MNVNLVEFWSVQQFSGGNVFAFLTVEDAQKQIDTWNKELDEKLERWKNGDYSVDSSLIESTLESDLEGGCYYSYHINTAWRPSNIYYHPKYTQEKYWEDLVNSKLISWGNPALVRPVKA